MKVLLLTDDLGPGGAQRQLVHLADGLVRNEHQVHCFVYHRNDYYLETLTEARINIIATEVISPIKRIIVVRRFIRKGKFDVVISFLGIPSFLAEISGIPYHRWKLIVCERSTNPSIKSSFKSRFIRIFHLFADYIVSNSIANQNLIQDINPLISKSKYRVIYNGLDLDRYKPLPGFIFCSSGLFRIIIPASYRRLKNLLGLIDALNQLTIEEKNKIRVEWFGDLNPGSHHDNVLIEAKKLILLYKLNNTIHLNDLAQDIQLIIQQADAVGLFSFFEGLPNAICEGMACGKPIIASNVSDIPLLVTDKVNGITCDPEDIHSIVSALRFLLNSTPSQLKEMGNISRQRAEKLFGLQEMVKQYLELIEV